MNVHSPLVIDLADSLRYRQACDASTQRVFAALTQRDLIQAWWRGTVRGLGTIGGQLQLCLEGTRPGIVVEVTQAADGAVDWLVTDDRGHDGEWRDTVIRFRVRPCGGTGSIIDFEHEGLTPAAACYETCVWAWQGFLGQLAEVAEGPVKAP
ncbi:SRPBCC family protein [Arenimonas sp. MALMAid1274]|uniref:SRPBCC family protein n=1 Tax=Arenimonas sp. MALMAid1274 TaxID=3411630 RepID=UPI003BA204AE